MEPHRFSTISLAGKRYVELYETDIEENLSKEEVQFFTSLLKKYGIFFILSEDGRSFDIAAGPGVHIRIAYMSQWIDFKCLIEALVEMDNDYEI